MSDELRTRTFGQWWEADERYVEVAVDEVAAVGAAAYQAVGATPEDAEYLFSFNLDKALQGDHARGVRIVRTIVESIRSGRMDLMAPIQVVSERPAAAVVSGGPTASPRLVCRRAMQVAIEKAGTQGVGWVSAQAHGEILTPYVRQAVDAGMVGVVFVQSVPNVAVLGGHGPLLGNAPLAVGVPAGRFDPVILDLSLTESSASGVGMTAGQGGQVPPGVLLDADGNPTTEAEAFVRRGEDGGVVLGSRMPRGSLTVLGGGHKGWALVFMVGLLASVLSDTSPPWELYYDLPERGTYGTIMLVLDPSMVGGPEEFATKVDDFIHVVKTEGGSPDVLYPGERSQALRRQRREQNRMALPEKDYAELAWLAEVGGVAVPPFTQEPPGG